MKRQIWHSSQTKSKPHDYKTEEKNLLGSDLLFPVFINPATPYDSVVHSYLTERKSERKSFY